MKILEIAITFSADGTVFTFFETLSRFYLFYRLLFSGADSYFINSDEAPQKVGWIAFKHVHTF